MSNISRDFKGIWIPREIWLDDSLDYFEKLLFAEIHSLDGKDGCFCSNEYLCNFFNERERKIQEGLSKLKKLGYISQLSFDGRTRILKTHMETIYAKFNTPDLSKSAPLACQNPHPSHIIEHREKKEVVCSVSPPVGATASNDHQKIQASENAIPASCSKKTCKGVEFTVTLQDVFTLAIQRRKNWGADEITESWKALIECGGPINSWEGFIEGTIKNLRNAKASKEITRKNKEKQCQKDYSEDNQSIKQLNNTNGKSTVRDTSGPAWPKSISDNKIWKEYFNS